MWPKWYQHHVRGLITGTDPPANRIDVLCGLVFLCFLQTVPECHQTLSKAFVDGSTRHRDRCSETHRDKVWRRGEDRRSTASTNSNKSVNDEMRARNKVISLSTGDFVSCVNVHGERERETWSIWCSAGSNEYKIFIVFHSFGGITHPRGQI